MSFNNCEPEKKYPNEIAKIVFSKEPLKYAKMAQEGLSGTDIRKAIYADKYAQED